MELSSCQTSLLVAASLLLLLLLVRRLASRLFRRHVICNAPGPPSWPLVGSHFSVELPLWRWVERHGKARYGNVIQVRFPTHLAVIVSGYKELREVFLNESLLGRPQLPWSKQMGASGGLALSEGRLWRAHRTFSVRALSDFGWACPAGQADIVEESRQIVEEIRDRLRPGPRRAAELDVGELITRGVSAFTSRMIFGCERVASDRRFRSKLPLVQSLGGYGNGDLGRAVASRLLRALPGGGFCRRLLRRRRGRPEQQSVLEALRLCQEQIDRRRRSLEDRQLDGYSDYIEFYLREKATYFSDDEGDGETEVQPPADLPDGPLAMTIFDLMTGGVDTVANLVRWALLLAALHPAAQERLRAELAIAGGDVAYADKARLPFTEAFLEEVQRFVSLLPEGVVRRAVADTSIGGFAIPRGTRIVPNLYGVHHDPRHFPEPLAFKPERFIRDGKFAPSRHLLPFSLGKRACPGEALARLEAFTLLTAVLRAFAVGLPTNVESARVDRLLRGCDGFVRRLANHRLVFAELPPLATVPTTPQSDA